MIRVIFADTPGERSDLLKRFLIYFSVFTVLLTLATPLLPVEGEDGVYGNTLRLHVLANSDSEEDQRLKLKVRDAVSEYAVAVFSCFKTKKEAEDAYRDALPEIEHLCRSVVLENGYDYGVEVSLGEEYFDTRRYEDLVYPAGYYDSLIVRIGKAEGKNWWCVLFPPLCLTAAKKEETLAEAGFTPGQIRILEGDAEPKYVVRFRILEWIESLFG